MLRAVDMYPYVKANLRKRYPYDDGWVIRKLDKERDNPDFVVDRRRKGYIERAIVEVIPDCYITQKHLEDLERHIQKHKDEGVEIIARIIVVCRDTDTTSVPKGIDIMFLRSCECNR